MALYHFSSKIIQRSKGRSVVAAAAYRSGTKIKSEYDGLIHNYKRKSGIVSSEIILPTNAPVWMTDRAMFWNSVEISEKRRDAQLAREIEFSLPLEFDQKTREAIAREFVVTEFVARGMIADVNFHDVDGKNPHVHVLLSLREVNENGFGNKNRDWNKKDLYATWRKKWEEKLNFALENAGIEERVSCESYATLGVEQQPQIHIGVHAVAMERREIETERGNINREIQRKNTEREADLPEITPLNLNPHLYAATPSPLIKGYWRRTAKNETRYFKKGTHEIAFIDKGNCLKISRQEDETLLTALKLASQKWGRVNISGDEEYRKRCIRIALQEGISILVDGKEAKEIQKSEAEKERQRVEAEKAEKERQRVEAEKKKQKSDLTTEARGKAIEVEAEKIAAKQQQLREQFDAAQEKWSLARESEPSFGIFGGIFGESEKHQIWAEEFEQQENDRRRAWEALGGDIGAPDKGEAEVKRRLTPEYARNEAEKVFEDMERREHAQQEAEEARKQREEAEIKAKAQRSAREKGYILPLKADPSKFVVLSISVNGRSGDVICKITSISNRAVKVVAKIEGTAGTQELVIDRDQIVNNSPAPPERTLPDERQAQQQNRRRSSNDLGR